MRRRFSKRRQLADAGAAGCGMHDRQVIENVPIHCCAVNAAEDHADLLDSDQFLDAVINRRGKRFRIPLSFTGRGPLHLARVSLHTATMSLFVASVASETKPFQF